MTIKRDVAPATVAHSWVRRAWTSLGIGVLVLIIVAAVLFRPIETAAVQYALGSTTGDDVRIGSVENIPGGMALLDLNIVAHDGGVQFSAARAEFGTRDNLAALTLNSPRATVTIDRADPHQFDKAEAALRRFAGNRDIRLHVDDGSLVLVADSRPDMRIAFDGITGEATTTANVPAFDVSAQLVAGSGRYALRGNARADDNGAIVQRWNADRVPLDALESLHIEPAINFRGGALDNVVVTLGNVLHASASLDKVALTLNGVVPQPAGDIDATLRASKADPPTPPRDAAPGHVQFDNLRGTLSVNGGSFESSGIAGNFNGVPFDLRGSTRESVTLADFALNGTPALRQLATLAGMIGAQSNLTFAHLETTAPGVAYAQYGVTTPIGPHVVSLVDVNPHEPTLHFDTALSSDKVISKGERTSDLGVRTSAVAGLNGDYFDIGRTYEPQGMLMRGGTLLHGPADRASLVIDRDANVTFAEFHLSGAVTTAHGRFAITQINSWPVGSTTVITPDYGRALPADPGTTFVRLAPEGDPAAGTYRVTAVQAANGPLDVSFGIAFGAKAKGPLPRVGERVVVHYALTPNVPGAIAGIGGGPILLKDGEWYEDAHAPAPDERDVRWPVDALGKAADGSLLLVAVDGRHPERSVGMTRPEFAALLQSFGVRDAMALDSGGSVTLVSRPPGAKTVAVRNVPSDDSFERYISDALFVYSSAPSAGASPLPITAGTATLPHVDPGPVSVPSAPGLASPAPSPT